MEEGTNNINKNSNIKKFLILSIIFCLISFFASNLIIILKGRSAVNGKNYLFDVVNKTEEKDKKKDFKGNLENNYVLYSNMLWRIVRVNSSGSVMLMLDNPINSMPNINIKEYLNNNFKKALDTTLLTENHICKDNIKDINTLKCEYVDNELVSLLDIQSFVNSIDNKETFIDNNIWLINDNDDNYWYTTESKLGYTDKSSLMGISPVVTLKNNTEVISGDGTKEKPYVVSKESFGVGSVVKIKDDLYTVYEVADTIKLVANNYEKLTYKYTGSMDGIFEYLNENIYNKLEYKDILIEKDWTVTDVFSNEETTVKSPIGLLELKDLKPNMIEDTYTLVKYKNYVSVYGYPSVLGTKNKEHKLAYCISISKSYAEKMNLVDGIYEVTV